MKIIPILFVTIFISCINNKGGKSKDLTVFVAAGFTPVFQEIKKEFEESEKINLKVNYASSGTLARQIEMGAKCDIYFSASLDWMDHLEKQGLLLAGDRNEVVQNSLVLISNSQIMNDSVTFDHIPEFLIDPDIKFSIGDPSHVPAGKYAQQALKNLKWDGLIEAKKVYAKDVRSVLQYVAMGEIPYGIVYYTDAITSDNVKILGTFPESSHKKIIISAAITAKEKSKEIDDFIEFIKSEKAKNLWSKYGYINLQ